MKTAALRFLLGVVAGVWVVAGVGMGTGCGHRHAPPVAGEERVLVLPGGAEMTMIYCPPGTFLMGSPKDEEGRSADEVQHEVTLTSGFWLGKTEVTQAQWCSVMGCDPFEEQWEMDEYVSQPDRHVWPLQGCNPSWVRGPDYPVHNLLWVRCQLFVAKINRKKFGVRVMLPTEAQWEYACRAGSAGPFAGTDVEDLAWHDEGHPEARAGGTPPRREKMMWGGSGARRRVVASPSGCPEKSERLGLPRHARQCGGVVPRRVRAVWRRWHGSHWPSNSGWIRR